MYRSLSFSSIPDCVVPHEPPQDTNYVKILLGYRYSFHGRRPDRSGEHGGDIWRTGSVVDNPRPRLSQSDFPSSGWMPRIQLCFGRFHERACRCSRARSFQFFEQLLERPPFDSQTAESSNGTMSVLTCASIIRARGPSVSYAVYQCRQRRWMPLHLLNYDCGSRFLSHRIADFNSRIRAPLRLLQSALSTLPSPLASPNVSASSEISMRVACRFITFIRRNLAVIFQFPIASPHFGLQEGS